MKMSQAPEILAALQQMRSEAEAAARQHHLSAAHEQRLEQTRRRIHALQPEALPPHVQQAYELSLRRAQIEWSYCSQAPEQAECEKAAQLSQLPSPPALSLEEQEAMLQALMCQAVVQYVDTAIAHAHEEPAA